MPRLLLRLLSYTPSIILCVMVLGLLAPTFVNAQGLLDAADSTIRAILYFIVVNFFGWLAGIAAYLLDWSVDRFVIGFGENYRSNGVGVAVDKLWIVVRDIFNIVFIFGLVYIGFRMIFGSNEAGAQRNLITLILAALLVNFSLFFTKFVVDFANLLAGEILNSGFKGSVGTTFFRHMEIAGTLEADTKIMNQDAAPWAFIFGSALIYIIAIFVFASAAIMIIIRFVALCIYMVLSPFLFLGWVFPSFSSTISKHWKGFLGRAFWAPVFAILIYFAGYILESLATKSAVGMSVIPKGVNDSQSAFANNIGPFLLASAFLIASVQVANSLSADGASTVMKVGNNMARGGQRRLQNTAMWTGRRLERTATALPRMAGRSIANSAGNQLNSQLDKMQKSRSSAIRAIAGSTLVADPIRSAATGLKSTKAGFSRTQGEANSAQSKIRSQQKAWQEIRDGIEASDPAMHTADSDKIYDPKTRQIMRKEDLKKRSQFDFEAAEKAQTAREKAKADMLGQLRDLSVAEVEQVFSNQPELFAQIVGDLDDGKIDKLMESDNLSSADKETLYKLRTDALKASITENGVTIASEFGKLSIKQIEMLGDQFIRDNAHMFTQDQLDAIKKSDKFTPTQKDAYKGARKQKIKDIINRGNQAEIEAIIHPYSSTTKKAVKRWDRSGGVFTEQRDVADVNTEKFIKASEIASLPIEALTEKYILDNLPKDALKQIGRDYAAGKSHLSAADIDTLAEKIEKSDNQAAKDYMKTAGAQRAFFDRNVRDQVN